MQTLSTEHIRNKPGAFCARTVADTSGAAYTETLAVLPRSSSEAVLHRLPLQTIRLEAIEGDLGVILPDRRLIVTAGRSVEIPRNTGYAFYNPGDGAVVYRSEIRPALHTEWMLKEIKASSRRHKKGLKALLERSYIISQIKGEYYRSGLPDKLQNLTNALLAAIGKLAGLHKQVSPLR